MTKKTKSTKKRKHDKKQSHDKGRVNSFISRHKVLIGLLTISGLCLLLRLLHLLNSDHYFIISHDSYYFHWISEHAIGETTPPFRAGLHPPPTWHTGLSYPLGWLSIALSSVSWLTHPEALTWACKLLPPFLGVIIALLIYWMGSRMYNRSVGILAALSWAVLSEAIFITSAGYLDRDPLSLLLVTTGILVFYLSKDWTLRIGQMNLGWMSGGLLVVGIEALLLIEWTRSGPILFLGLLTAYFVATFLAGLYANIIITVDDKRLSRLFSSVKLVPRKIVPALRETNWRPFTVIVFFNLLALFIIPDFAPASLFDRIGDVFNPDIGLATTSEMQGMSLSDLYPYIFLSIPLLIGIYHTLKTRRPSDILWLTWFVLLFILGFYTQRIFIYATVPACMLSGLGLGILYNYQRTHSDQPLIKIVAQILLVGLILLSILYSLDYAHRLGSQRLLAPDKNWYDALIWLKDEENTPEDAVIMTWWDYGYWTLDIAERRPVVDNGYRPESRLQDIAKVYFAQQDSEAVKLMQKYGASYVVFSLDERYILQVIGIYSKEQPYGGDPYILPSRQETEGSLYARALDKDINFESSVFDVKRYGKVVILSIKE